MSGRFLYKSKGVTTKQGFTLIEVMVSVTIFTIITTIGLGALLSTVTASRQAQAERSALDSLNFVVDAMSREIRTGSKYSPSGLPASGPTGNNGASSVNFSFVNQDGCDVTYALDTSGSSGFIKRRRSDACGDGTFHALTDTRILNVTGLLFRVRGANNTVSDTEQPFVTFTVSADARSSQQEASIVLQSSVTQRLLDIPQGN